MNTIESGRKCKLYSVDGECRVLAERTLLAHGYVGSANVVSDGDIRDMLLNLRANRLAQGIEAGHYFRFAERISNGGSPYRVVLSYSR